MKPFKTTLLIVLISLVSGCAQNASHKLISPLPSGIDTGNMQDCTVVAAFNADDFKWMGGNLHMTVFSKELYDIVDIHQMQVGDTLLFAGQPVVINSLNTNEGRIDINGGLDQGGYCLVGYEGGTYIARNWDDYPTYSQLGQSEVALAENFVIIDCGLEPNDPIDTIRSEQKQYIESLEDSRREFNQLNTTVTIENGMITEINRHWIP